MDNLEKVEKLRERANVSYEEAKKALEDNNWDLLEAMVQLEKQGKTDGPAKSQYSTSYEEQDQYLPVEKTVCKEKDEKEHKERPHKGFFRKCLRTCRDNFFCIRRHEELVFKLPILVLLVILLCTWKVTVPVLIIGLFFNFRYSLEGKDELKEANDIISSAAKAAEKVKEEFQKESHSEA